MTFDQAIAILESLKDSINENGKRELTVVQKAITEWEAKMTDVQPDPPPAVAIEPEVVPKFLKPDSFKPKNVVHRAPVKAKKKK